MSENLNLHTIDTVDTSPFKKLVMTIGELPTSFVESMTYYEALAWFVDYLQNTIIPAVNNNADAVTELQNLYTTLYKYVHDYFDNLDVQEEIDNKLDEMVADGTLQEIIADYLNSKAVFGFDSVSEMKNATNLINGSYARTLGYYSKNDGGSALYKIREITNSDVVDERFIIAIGSNDLVAELITDNMVNICQVGGQQNFSTVCNALLSSGKSVYVPDQDFTCNSSIIMSNDNSQFICDGNITYTGENSSFFIFKANFCKIEFNGIVDCGSTNVFMEIGNGIGTKNNIININKVTSCKIGLWINPNGNTGTQFLRCTFNRIYSSEKGIYFNPGNDGNPWINGNTFIGGALDGPYGIVTRKGGESHTNDFNDNSFERIAFTGHIQCALDLQFMKFSWFSKMRISENLEGTYDIVLDACDSIFIENEAKIKLSKVHSINTTIESSRHILKAPGIQDSTGYYVGDQLIYVMDQPYLAHDHLWRYGSNKLYAYSDDDTNFNVPEYYFEDIMVTIGANSSGLTLEYVLPQIFNDQLKDFYLLVKYKNKNTSLTLKNAKGTTIMAFPADPDSQHITNGLYHCVRTGATTSPNIHEWKVFAVENVRVTS